MVKKTHVSVYRLLSSPSNKRIVLVSSQKTPCRSRIPVYKHKEDIILGQRAVTQMEISRTYEDLSRLELSLCHEKDSVVKKGLMWIQQDKLLSRWTERFIILTNGYL